MVRRPSQSGPNQLAKESAAHFIPPLDLALAFIVFLGCFFFLPRVHGNPRLAMSFGAATGILAIFLLLLRREVVRSGRTLRYEVVVKKVHYVQLLMQSCVYAYWGWYWRDVYHFAPLIVAQLVFAYALDMLVCWSQRDRWVLGFGPFPILLSMNLFLWFKDDWFFLQFLMVATGVLGKEFIKWRREGRLVHIFNPSALALAVFSVALIATKSTNISWGVEIADHIHTPPHIYFEIFLLGLIVQGLFQVTLVTLSAAAALLALNVCYTQMTGGYFFINSNIPVAVFLGLHLLVTDPATSPRKDLGKVVFGGLYGAAVFGLYGLLGWLGAPEFYDKLLCVPVLNLSVQFLDRGCEAVWSLCDRYGAKYRARLGSLRPAWVRSPREVNFVYMGVWFSLFATMTATGFLTTNRQHPGSDPAFWGQACEQGHSSACKTWMRMLTIGCEEKSGDDCLILGRVLNDGSLVPRDAAAAARNFSHACELGVTEACGSVEDLPKPDDKDAPGIR